MPLLPVLSGREVVLVFERLGGQAARQRGSHIILVKPEHIATLSVPDQEEPAKGRLRSPIRAAGLTVEVFMAEASGSDWQAMPRRPRLALAGVAAHTIRPGNNRGACFFADEDYALYLRHLAELARLCGCAVHAYVLMTNHVHLLVTPKEAHATLLLMKHLGQRYRSTSIAPTAAAAHSGRGASAPAWRSPRLTCWPATSTSSSTPCAPTWWLTRGRTAGAVKYHRQSRWLELLAPRRRLQDR
jgi:REP element-mobilizing transposase RayT/predicted RNA binding protein YcfA (HicA-like mRNA interferase family)